MSISETFRYDGTVEVDTSNYRKHMSDNPVQRTLIDRFHRKIAGIVQDLEPDTLLDAGCGEGFVADTFLKAMPEARITGFDLLEESVKLAQLRNPRASFSVGDIYHIDHPDKSFDVVYSFEVLEHLEDPERALKELTRVATHAVMLSVPHEPFFCLANASRGKNLDVRPRGSDPDHRNFWSRGAFGTFVEQEMDVEQLTGSFPWTICVGRPRSR